MTWGAILRQWSLVVADLHSEYGIEISLELLRAQSWSWLRTRILGLLHADTRLYRALAPRPDGQ